MIFYTIGKRIARHINSMILDILLDDDSIDELKRFELFFAIDTLNNTTTYVLKILCRIKDISHEFIDVLCRNIFYHEYSMFNLIVHQGDKSSKKDFNVMFQKLLQAQISWSYEQQNNIIITFIINNYFGYPNFDNTLLDSILTYIDNVSFDADEKSRSKIIELLKYYTLHNKNAINNTHIVPLIKRFIINNSLDITTKFCVPT